jgi:O-antigen ligase
MQTNSFIINKIINGLAALNFYFEQSRLYRGVNAVKSATRGSRIITAFLRTDHRDYWQGSFIMRLIGFIIGGIMVFFSWCIRAVAKANEHSINNKLYARIKRIRIPMVLNQAVKGCVPYKLVTWFFGEAEKTAPYKIVYMLFLSGALMIPGHFWNNMLLLFSAVFFAGVYIIKWSLHGASMAKPSNAEGVSPLISPALILFILFCALSIFTGYGGSDSTRVFIIFLSCVVHSILVISTIRNMSDLRLFIKFIVVALAVTALYGFYNLAVGIPIRTEFTDLLANPGLARLHSTMGNPNNDAQMWAMLLPFVFALVFAGKCDKKRVLFIGVIALCVAALALTYSRAGYVALMAGVGIFVLMAAPRLVPVAFIALILAIPFIPAGVIERLLTLGTDTSSLYRFNIWRAVWDILQDYWVRGIGMGPVAFAQVYRNYIHGEALRALHAHNTFLDIFVHSGVGAFVAFLAYLFRLLKRGISAHMASRDKEYKLFTAAAIAALVVFVVFGAGEYVWFYPRVMLVFWVIAGVATAVMGFNSTHTRERCGDEPR